ncbi:transporter [Mycolicibacterium agri]|uniref:Probable membrane transporter protein n=1 Tax=Mycolicibacterium agri TaxID=36811 RepID=A0A2A7NCU0_MYCAG|nr:sulfite exporter TauE/SafE family protein [Mycolicibacterium agri]PEG41754.1 transporter [Mycolicibacterium agri]GFG49999.1 UPF0721 transmembrane protein [Mycolicibacterium agri]
MAWWDAAFLAVAGVAGGLTGSIAGLASVATYPALLVVGLPPVTANVTNTVALVFSGIGSVWGSRPEMKGQSRWLRRIIPAAAVGGAAGAALLLSTPAEGFEYAVPILIGFASLAIVLPRKPARGATVADHRRLTLATVAEFVAIFLICIYGGYFGAAAGVLMLALLLRAGHATLAHANAGKNVIAGVANSVAAAAFVIVATVHWAAVAALGIGCLLGSRLGPVVVRHAPAGPMRVLIGTSGVALAVKLGIDTYG